jgi:hypothetical protein
MMRRNVAFGLAFFCLTLLGVAMRGQAAPPTNDECNGAEIISLSGASPWLSSITTNMHEATVVNDPPQPTNCYAGPISKSIWYEFTPVVSGLYTVSLKFTATTMEDSLMGIYTSPMACGGPFTQYACNDDIGTLQSAVTTNFNAGTRYYVVIWHTLTTPLPEAQRNVQLKITKVEPPLNDTCDRAAVIPSTSFPYWTTTTNTHLASTNSDPPGPFCPAEETSPQRSVWYKFRPAEGGNYIIATCTNTTATKIYNTMLAVYKNTGGCAGTWEPIGCNPGLCGTSAGLITFLEPDKDYYIVVWDLASLTDPTPLPDETDVQLLVDKQGLPTVTTIGHTNVTPTSVTLLAEANPKGSVTRGFFEWGTTPGYGNVTVPFSTLGGGIVPFPYGRTVIDQAPGTTLYYRAAATNAFGVVYGQGQSVTLPFPQPIITSVTKQGADLRIQFTGTEGFIHEVQVSEDLRNWTRLADATPLEFDQFEYVDQGVLTDNNRKQRFYRIKL